MNLKMPSNIKLPSSPLIDKTKAKMTGWANEANSYIQSKVPEYKEKIMKEAKEKAAEHGLDKYMSKEALMDEVKKKAAAEGIDLTGVELPEDISIKDMLLPEVKIPTKEEIKAKVQNFKMPTLSDIKAYATEKVDTTKETISMMKDIKDGDYTKVVESMAAKNDIPIDMSQIESQVDQYMQEGH